ncbi:hypothetical protein SUGI_0639330 [Cryptomeria japonica]|nr:hypothetical protein SUGI_0639330 [Cryptomeria japonica]
MWTHNIEHLLSTLVDYRMQHTYREGNREADWLANKGVEAVLDHTFDNSIDWDQSFTDILFSDAETAFKKGIGGGMVRVYFNPAVFFSDEEEDPEVEEEEIERLNVEKKRKENFVVKSWEVF